MDCPDPPCLRASTLGRVKEMAVPEWEELEGGFRPYAACYGKVMVIDLILSSICHWVWTSNRP